MSIMEDQNTSYAPRSPDLSAYHSSVPPSGPPPQQAYYSPPNHQTHQVLHSPAFPNQYVLQQSPITPYPPQVKYEPGTPVLPHPVSQRRTASDMDEEWGAPAEPARRGRKPKKPKMEFSEPEEPQKPAPGVEEGIEVKTKFPVARIKRIMQADEDVGKVAQVTPTAVCKS